jgi:hypothetical protein
MLSSSTRPVYVAFYLAAGVVLCAACGGSDFATSTAGDDAGTDGASNVGAGDSSVADGPRAEAGGGPDSGGAADGPLDAIPTDGQAGDAPAALDGPASACPDVAGSYGIVVVEAGGCAGLDATAQECVRQSQGCGIEFRSSVSGGGPAAIDGTATVTAAGSVSGATLMEGNSQRSGCTGTWSAATSTMTVDCGGTGSSQSCLVTLTRTSTASCN